jgi:molybdate transport system ATP-binding protein
VGDRRLSVSLRQPAPIPLEVDFTCDAGDVLAIFGPSGSGKTTILRSIAGRSGSSSRSTRSFHT